MAYANILLCLGHMHILHGTLLSLVEKKKFSEGQQVETGSSNLSFVTSVYYLCNTI